MSDNNSQYEKIYLKWWAKIQNYNGFEVIKCSIKVQDLLEKINSGQFYITQGWYLYFDIVPKREVKQWESTHYMSHSRKKGQGTAVDTWDWYQSWGMLGQPVDDWYDDDLPF